MSTSVSALTENPPDPEELPADARSFPIGMLLAGLIAYFFSLILPGWRPLVWWLITVSTGVLRLTVIRRTQFDQLSQRQRCWRLRGLIWAFMAANASAAYFLYVPGDPLAQTVLGVYLLAVCTVLIFHHVSSLDETRVMVALYIVALPTGLRLVLEGISEGRSISWILGISTLIVPILLVQIANIQMRLMHQQFIARLQAENAVQALNDVTLAKSRFFAAISHDLRQPVHAIGLYLDAIEPVVAQTGHAVAQQAVAGISLSWQSLNALLSQVLDLARLEANIEQADLQPVALQPLLDELLLLHRSLAEERQVHLRARVTPTQYVLADPVMLRRVLTNLLGNALKYSPSGRVVLLAVRPAGRCWQIQVRDAGQGIAEDQQEQIFSEFVQLDNDARSPAQGFGLGLAIAKRLTLLQQGQIGVRSRPGHGCCMSVSLLRHEDSAAAGISQSGAASRDFLSTRTQLFTGRRILLVEDDTLVGQGMLHLLQSWGAQVEWSGTAALAWQARAACELILCDVRLPGQESGIMLAQRLQAEGRKVILVSGETDTATRQLAARFGLMLLTKPVAPLALQSALEALLDR